MPAKRGDRVAAPAGPNHWNVIFGTSEAAKGWENLCAQAPGNTRVAWQVMCTDPQPTTPTERQHRLRAGLAYGSYRGVAEALPQWQIEVTGGGRIWYLVDEERRRVILQYADTRHPKQTE